MYSDKRLLFALRNSLLGLALCAGASTGCGTAAGDDLQSEAARTGDPSLLEAPNEPAALVSTVEDVAGELSESTRQLGASELLAVRGAEPTQQSASRAGPYRVQRYTSGYRNGPAFADATMNYPADAEPPFASIAIVPGFMSAQSSIASWGPFLASHGIVAFTIGTNTVADQPPARARALLDALETIRGENTRANSPLQGKLDLTRMAIGGWSMGGGGTLQASQSTPSLKAAIAICPWNPGAGYGRQKVPTLFFAGTADVLAGGQSQGFYRSIPESTPKILYEVGGASHFYANSPSGQGGAVGRYGLSFLKVYLEDDVRYKQFLIQKGPGASDFRTNIK